MTFPTTSEEVSALPAAGSVTATTTVVSAQNPDGSPGGSLLEIGSLVSVGLGGLPGAATAPAGTDKVVGTVGGVPSLIEISALPSSGGSGGGTTTLNRPALSAMTLLYGLTTTVPATPTNNPYVFDVNSAGALTGPIVLSLGANGDNFTGAAIAHGRTGEFSIYGQIVLNMTQSQPSSGLEQVAGIGLYDTSSGNAVIIGGTCSTNNKSRMLMQTITNTGTANPAYAYGDAAIGPGLNAIVEAGTKHWQRLRYNGSTYDWFISINGYTWIPIAAGVSLSAIFSDVPDKLCFFGALGNVAGGLAGLEVYQLFGASP